MLVSGASAQDLSDDKDCGDFDTWAQAQTGYERARAQLEGDDPWRLDANGDGIACEGLPSVRRVQVTDSSFYETEEHVGMLTCPDTSFALSDFHDAVDEVYEGEGSHKELHTMWDCVDLHATMLQN